MAFNGLLAKILKISTNDQSKIEDETMQCLRQSAEIMVSEGGYKKDVCFAGKTYVVSRY